MEKKNINAVLGHEDLAAMVARMQTATSENPGWCLVFMDFKNDAFLLEGSEVADNGIELSCHSHDHAVRFKTRLDTTTAKTYRVGDGHLMLKGEDAMGRSFGLFPMPMIGFAQYVGTRKQQKPKAKKAKKR